MKIVHSIKISVFENKDSTKIEKIEKTLESLFPFEIKKFLIKKTVHGTLDKEILTYTVELSNNSIINQFLKHFFTQIPKDQKKILQKQIETRLDKDLHFFIRLDKDKLLNNEYTLTDSGNCFHINIGIASYPKNRKTGLKIIKELLNGPGEIRTLGLRLSLE